MNWQTIERRYKEYKGQLRSKWGKLTDNELELARGRRNVLVGKLQQRYGIPQRAAERQLDEWVQSL
jgi:uncharacterized protein YjbJ (UPF0337 family)